jgi:uncharacterized protein (DUF1499 family)
MHFCELRAILTKIGNLTNLSIIIAVHYTCREWKAKMSAHQKTSVWASLFLYLVLFDLLLIGIGVGGRILLDWSPLTSFHLYFYGAQAGLVFAVFGLIQLGFGLYKKQQLHKVTGVLTMLCGLLPLLLALASVGVSGFKAPMIHDISTDLNDPPVYSITNSLRTAAENSLEHAGESIASLQREAFPDIQPFFSELSANDARKLALATVDALGWILIVDDESTGSIEAYEQSAVFGFIDDVVIRITAIEGGSQIDLRSVSRVGLGDLGANAERIRRFFREFARQSTT